MISDRSLRIADTEVFKLRVTPDVKVKATDILKTYGSRLLFFWQTWPLASAVSSWSGSSWSGSSGGCDEQLMEAVQELGAHMLQLAVNIH